MEKPVQQHLRLECLHLVLGDSDRMGLLLVYCPPHYAALPDGAGWPGLWCEDHVPQVASAGDFNIHAKAIGDKPAQVFLATIATLGPSQEVSDPMHWGGHTLDLAFCSGQDDLKVENMIITLFVMDKSQSVAV